MSSDLFESTAPGSEVKPSEFRWGLLAAASGIALWKATPTSTILKLLGMIAGGAVAYQVLKPKSPKPDDGAAHEASNALDEEEARAATQRLASAWGAHLTDAREKQHEVVEPGR
jgi:hypothetical protein